MSLIVRGVMNVQRKFERFVVCRLITWVGAMIARISLGKGKEGDVLPDYSGRALVLQRFTYFIWLSLWPTAYTGTSPCS